MKKIHIIILSILVVLLGAGITLFYISDISKSNQIYEDSARDYTALSESDESYEGCDDSFDEESEMITSSVTSENTDETDTDTESDIDDAQESDAADEQTYSFRYEGPWTNQINVDIRSIMSKYPDVKGWLFFENEDISYPIVQGLSDDTYLRTSYDGQKTVAGSIFMESENAYDFSDPHTIIYGHNMRNNTMFGHLDNYMKHSGYYDYHKYFQIITTDTSGNTVKYRYKIFSYGKTTASSKVYTVCRSNDEVFGDVIQYIQSGALKLTDVPVYQTDQVITLSTCSGKNNRVYVSAVKIDSYSEVSGN